VEVQDVGVQPARGQAREVAVAAGGVVDANVVL
jgi:hypothetical protein